jgi:uncharacterized protein YdaU (DUF1376 family)
MSDSNPPPWDSQRFPYYKRWAKDFLSSGRLLGMNHLQRSIYSVLLDRCWVEDGLPTDRNELAMLALCTPAELEEAWVWPLDTAFTEQDGRYRNPKMEDVRAEAMRVRTAQARGGSKSPQVTSKSLEDTSKSLPSDLPVTSSTCEVTRSKPESEQSQSKSKAQEVVSQPSAGSAAAPAPQAEQTRRSKRANREANMLEACERINAPAWLPEALGVYMRARMSAKFKVWSTELWEDEAEQVLKLGEEAGRKLCMRASKKPWSKIVFEDSFDANAQQTSSQGPSRGGFYRGPALKDVEARTARRNIADRYRQMTGNILLEDEDAFEMARADDDWHMHDYDWKTGRRNDAPPDKPRNGTTIDFPPTPF